MLRRKRLLRIVGWLPIGIPPAIVLAVTWRIASASSGIPLHGDLAFPLYLQRYTDLFQTMWDPHSNASNLEQIDRLLFIRPILWVLAAMNASTLDLAKTLIIGLLVVSGLSAFGL